MKLQKIILGIILFFGITLNALAVEITKIAILDFELNDITSLPNTPDEIIQINSKDYAFQNAGPGYLYKFHDIAASLGKKVGANWVIVGQHSKPSFLFSYIMANLVNVKTKNLVARYEIELKGSHRKVTERGIKAISKKIKTRIEQYKPNQ